MAAQSWTHWLQSVMQVGDTPLSIRHKRQVIRIDIGADESYVLPESICEIRVVTGKAWICSDKKDVVAYHGQRVIFSKHDATTTIVPLGQKPLVIDATSR